MSKLQSDILKALEDKSNWSPPSVAKLARLLGKKPQSVSRAIQTLKKNGKIK